MGNARYSSVDWTAHSSAIGSKSRHEIFTSIAMDPALDPKGVKRECVASAANPHPTPIIIGSDVTGSMGVLAETFIKTGLGVIMEKLYDTKPVSDPQILCAAIGDATCDRAPLQVTQFEASVGPMVEQLAKVYIEGGGGGNDGESYPLVWAFAAYQTRPDAVRKEGRKGYLFTIGDENPLPTIKKHALAEFLGLKEPRADMDIRVLLKDVQKDWEVFHIIVKPIHAKVVKNWKDLLGERAINATGLSMEKIAEGIAGIVQTLNGQRPTVSKETALVISEVVDAVVVR